MLLLMLCGVESSVRDGNILLLHGPASSVPLLALSMDKGCMVGITGIIISISKSLCSMRTKTHDNPLRSGVVLADHCG